MTATLVQPPRLFANGEAVYLIPIDARISPVDLLRVHDTLLRGMLPKLLRLEQDVRSMLTRCSEDQPVERPAEDERPRSVEDPDEFMQRLDSLEDRLRLLILRAKRRKQAPSGRDASHLGDGPPAQSARQQLRWLTQRLGQRSGSSVRCALEASPRFLERRRAHDAALRDGTCDPATHRSLSGCTHTLAVLCEVQEDGRTRYEAIMRR